MKELLVALLLARGADAVTTCTALAAGAHEVQPLAPQNCAGAVAMSAGLGVSQVLLIRAVEKRNARAGRILGLVSFGVVAGTVGNNIRVNVEIRRR